MINKIETIYVALIGEGTSVWRPVEAELIKANQYRILSRNDNPEDEEWEFKTGDIVNCEQRLLKDTASSLCWVAVSTHK